MAAVQRVMAGNRWGSLRPTQAMLCGQGSQAAGQDGCLAGRGGKGGGLQLQRRYVLNMSSRMA